MLGVGHSWPPGVSASAGQPQTPGSSASAGQRHHRHSHGVGSQHLQGSHLLQVEGLSVSFMMYDPDEPRFFHARQVQVDVISDLHISVHSHEIVAVVGASGSGKTLLADAIMGIFASNATVRGRVWYMGVEQDAASIAALRGNGVSLVPQSVLGLDPLMRVGPQIRGPHGKQGKMLALLGRFGLAEGVARLYPHQLSGGMARRVLLCCALMDDPKLIIADEPTPGLDPAMARQALADLRGFADEGGGVMLITHDIELALGVADRVAVFWQGTVVEETAASSFASPDTLEHPFSKALWHAMPEHGLHVDKGGLPPPDGDGHA